MRIRTVVLPMLRGAVAVIALLATSRLHAQCSDGAPPPCRQAVAPRTVPVDANRVAVIPFRVTAADSLLGEGFAELLAQEFTGVGGPRSIDMSTTLSAWRRAGGGLRAPLPLDSAMLLARRVGAGILLQGSITGLAGRLSITAAMVNSATAAPIGEPARTAGSVDSVESLLRQVAASLLGVGASERVLKSARLSKSPAALRSYLEGLAQWRRGHIIEAARSFEASVAADATFGSALYQRWLMGQAYSGGGLLSEGWRPRVRARVDLLTPRERRVFEAFDGGGQPRPRMQAFSERRRAAEELGDSPDAWFLVGDYVFHFGNAVVGPDSVVPLARQFFSLAVALDTQPVFLFHLSELAINARDTALMRHLIGAYSGIEGEERWIHRWVLAAALKDDPMMESLRRAGPPRTWTNTTLFALGAALDTRIPIAAYEEAGKLLSDYGPKRALTGLIRNAQVARGRMTAAGSLRLPTTIDNVMDAAAFAVTGDAIDTLLINALGANALPDTSIEAGRQCLRARLAIERRVAVANLETIRLEPRCRSALRALDAFNRGTLTDSALARLDTLVTIGNVNIFMGFEHRVLSRIYEARGDTARAVRAIQYYPRDYGGAWSAPTQREAGRLFLMAKDTARAIAAYERYLELRTEAQPPIIAERDSIRALVGRLTRRVVP